MRKINVFVLLGLLFACACTQQAPALPPLQIAVAANFATTAAQLGEKFSSETGIKVNISSASTAKLALQISEGANHHIFLSADTAAPGRLYRQGELAGPPLVYCQGQLLLMSPKNAHFPDLQSLASPTLHHLAIANPETAPYGKAAMEALTSSSLLPVVKEKLVIGESIAQVNLYLQNGNTEAALTSGSARMDLPGFEAHLIPQTHYQPILQGMGITRKGAVQNPVAAQKFMDFMQSEAAQTLIQAAGYLAPKP